MPQAGSILGLRAVGAIEAYSRLVSDDEIDEVTRRMRQEFRAAVERLKPQSLVGLSVAEARARVEAAGGAFVAQGPNEPATADLSNNRVRAIVVNGRVTDANVS